MSGITLKSDDVGKIKLPVDPIYDLLKIYRKEKIAEIDMEADADIQITREHSKIGKIYNKILNYTQKELKSAYGDDYKKVEHKIYISFDNEEETQMDIDKIIETRNNTIEELDDMIKKVEIMLALAETYEHKIDVLKRYGILDEDGIF